MPVPLYPLVDRPGLQAAVVESLVADRPGGGRAIVTLSGGGGFGKTTLAVQVCRLDEIARRFPGGVLWTTLGETVAGPALAERINDLCEALGGYRPAFSDPERAGFRLAELLADRPDMLLVIDDVWRSPQLRPFLAGLGGNVQVLVTTRDRSLLPQTGIQIVVDAMSSGEALELVGAGLGGAIEGGVADNLLQRTGRWPVLLSLVNGAMHRAVREGMSVREAAHAALGSLESNGPADFDLRRPEERREAVRVTMESSLDMLGPPDLERYLDLAIFPEDTDVPVALLQTWWQAAYGLTVGDTERLIEDFQRLSLLARLRRANGSTAIRLHDVVRDFIRWQCGTRDLQQRNRSMLDVARSSMLADGTDGAPTPWWSLPAEAGYLWRTLAYHLAGAGLSAELDAVVTDLRWVVAKIELGGGPAGAEADLSMARTARSATLARALGRSAHLLSPVRPSIVDTLIAQLSTETRLAPIIEAFLATYGAARLVPLWPLPDRPPSGAKRTIDSHHTWLRACALSKDDRLIATAGDDHAVRFFDFATGDAGPVLTGHAAPVRGCAFFPRGTRFVSASDDSTVRVWDRVSGAELMVLTGHVGRVRGCAVAPDGLWFASAGDDGTLRVWDAASGLARVVLRGHVGPVRSCAVDPAGRWIVSSGDDATVRLWDPGGGPPAMTLTGHGDWVNACAVAPDGRWIASVGDDLTLRIWEAATGAARLTVKDSSDWVYCCAVAPNGRTVASGCADGRLYLHDAATGRMLVGFAGHRAGVRGAVFTSDSRSLVTVGDDATVRVWDTAGLSTMDPPAGGVPDTNACAVSPDGQMLVTGGDDGMVRLWRVEDPDSPRPLGPFGDWIRACAFAADGSRFAVAGDDGLLVIHDASGRLVSAIGGGDGGTTHLACAFSPDGRLLASGGNDSAVRLWDTTTGKQTTVITGHTGWVNACAFSPDGRLLATGGEDRTVRLFDSSTGRGIATIVVNGALRGCAWVPDKPEPAICAVGAGGIYLFSLVPGASSARSAGP